MANVSIVVGLFFLIFAIMGVQLFGGRFWTCNDISVANKVSASTQPAVLVHASMLMHHNNVAQHCPAHVELGMCRDDHISIQRIIQM